MTAPALDLLRTANQEICSFLALAGTDSRDLIQESSAGISRMKMLSDRLAAVGTLLRDVNLQARREPPVSNEAGAYIRNLEALALALEELGVRLRAARAQLEIEKAQLNATGAWAAACRETF